MVMPAHGVEGPEWPKWRRMLIRLFGASMVFSVVWWLIRRDITETLIAALTPWVIALGFLAVSLVWATVLIPLMIFIGKHGGRKPESKAGHSGGG
jgi:peptidoglycan biosynthesis protein MviN/MurJ (putative lipid II flippase)